MSHSRIPLGVATLAILSSAGPSIARTQSLDSRIRSSSAARIQFEFPARSDVCGDGQGFLSIGSGSSYYGNVNVINGVSSQPCAAGPVRVVIDRADGIVTGIETVAGPLHPADAATDLGSVTAKDAVDYLMSIATKTDGRASRDAILPAAIAAGVDISPTLTTIALDQNRPLDTRRSALSWLARDNADEAGPHSANVTDLLLRVARNENETQAMRRHALTLLGHVGHGAGIPALTRLASDNSTTWIGDESLRALAQSGDPRAREFLRKELRRTDLPDPQMATVVRGLGSGEATGQDIELLRNAFSAFPGDRARGAVMDVVAQRGTAGDTQWLLDIARDAHQSPETRRRALDIAARSTSGSAQTLGLYDTIDDASLKQSLIRIYAQSSDRASVDKLISIAKSDSNYALRRSAIASLSRTQDPRARQALLEMTTR
jgi:HEAT repeat protein